MRWRTGRESENVEDRRGQGPQYGRGVRVGGMGGLGLIVVVVIALLTGIDPLALLSELGSGSAIPSGPPGRIDAPSTSRPAGADEPARFASVVLADTEDTWGQIFSAAGRRYQAPRLVLFDGATPSACGQGSAAMGPFIDMRASSAFIITSMDRLLSYSTILTLAGLLIVFRRRLP